MPRILASLFLLFSLVTLSGCANGLFYHPDAISYGTPSIPYETVQFKSGDGTLLSGWFIPARGTPAGTVIHFHGNAANISNHYGFVKWIPHEGFNLFMFDYRGYGDSEGRPNRKGLHLDSVAALKYVAERDDVDQKSLIVMGQSLGGANAVDAVVSVPEVMVRGVVVDSSFYSYRSIARDKAGLIPIVGWFKHPLSYLFATNAHSAGPVMDQITAPVIVIHGTHDPVIPFEHGQRLYDAANEPKELWIIEGGGHTSAMIQKDDVWRQRLAAMFRAWVSRTQ